MARAFGEKTIALVDPESLLIKQYILEFPGFALRECPSPIIALQNQLHFMRSPARLFAVAPHKSAQDICWVGTWGRPGERNL